MLGTATSLICLVPATWACACYLAYTLAGMLQGWARTRPRTSDGRNERSFAILIPAHNEETTLPTALRSVTALDYPANRVQVFVVADNCTDRTADVARENRASCLVRDAPNQRGKGLALAFGLDRLAGDDQDVILILDADCTLSRNALRELNVAFELGADVAQMAVRSRNADTGPAGYVAAVGAEVDDGVAAGRGWLGRSVPLRGTGMAFRREVLGWVQWGTDSPVEDAEYDRQVQAAGGRARYCGRAVVGCDAPAGPRELCQQRKRWRAAIRSRGWMESKPIVLAQLLVTLAVCLVTGAFVGWAVALVVLTATVYARAAVRVGITWHRIRLLFGTPAVVARLAWVGFAGLVSRKVEGWARAPRVGDQTVV
jgi:cellulose synthase/poly-beta-1,6-N-acetylglucosamine synthase-like glycosyltransferase